MSSSTFFGSSPNTFTDYETLPRDMQKEIIHHLPTDDFISMWFTSKALRELITDDVGLKNKINTIITLIKKIHVVNLANNDMKEIMKYGSYTNTLDDPSFLEIRNKVIRDIFLDSHLFDESMIDDIDVSAYAREPKLHSFIPKILSGDIQPATVEILLLKKEKRLKKILTAAQIAKLHEENNYILFSAVFDCVSNYGTLFLMEKLMTPEEFHKINSHLGFFIATELFSEPCFLALKKKLLSLDEILKMDTNTINMLFKNTDMYLLHKRRAFLDHPENWLQAGAANIQDFDDRFNQLTPSMQLLVALGASLNTAESIHNNRKTIINDLVKRTMEIQKSDNCIQGQFFYDLKNTVTNNFNDKSDFFLASIIERLVSLDDYAKDLFASYVNSRTGSGKRHSCLEMIANTAPGFCLLKDELITVAEAEAIQHVSEPQLFNDFFHTIEHDHEFLLSRKEFILNSTNQLAANAANSEELRQRLISLPFDLQRGVVNGTLTLQNVEGLTVQHEFETTTLKK